MATTTPALSKREFYAAMALSGILARQVATNPADRKVNAEHAVQVADELMDALVRIPTPTPKKK